MALRNQTITDELTETEKMDMKSLCSRSGKPLSDIISCKFGSPGKSKHYVICIQGASSSGKSTLANNLYKLFLANNQSVMLIELDRYYSTLTDYKDSDGYDFDNPASINWSNVHHTLKAIHEGKKYIPMYEYSFITKINRGPFYVKNTFPKIVILEGIYGFNVFGKKIYDVSKFDARNSAKVIDNPFITNTANYPYFKVMNIKMSTCKERSFNVRICRDTVQRGWDYYKAIEQFHQYVWPATEKWINNKEFEVDIAVVHGSFNRGIRYVTAALSFYFLEKHFYADDVEFGDFKAQGCCGCSGECLMLDGAEFILKDK